MADGAENTQLVTIEKADALAVFTTPAKMEPVLAQVRARIDAFEADVSTEAGRDAIRSIAYSVARSKTYLDGVGKELVDEQKKIPNLIDAARRRIRDTLDTWKDEVRKPLTEWEVAEKERLDVIRFELGRMQAIIDDRQPLPPADLRSKWNALTEFVVEENTFGEHTAEAQSRKNAALSVLSQRIVEAEQRERDAVELAKLRAEAAERERVEQEARARKEAEERAARQQQEQAERERRAAERAVQAAKDEAERREREHALALAAAERKALEAEQRARAEALAQARREAAERERREADEAHRNAVHKEVLKALMATGISEPDVAGIITLISQGLVPHVSINY